MKFEEAIKVKSLKSIAEATNVCYQYLLKVAKKPVAGAAYDPNAINVDEVKKVLSRKVNLDEFEFDEAKSVELGDEYGNDGRVVYKNSKYYVVEFADESMKVYKLRG